MLPVFRMSSSGYCPRRLSATYLNIKERIPAPPWLMTAAKEGIVHERLMKDKLVELGCEVIGDQDEVELTYPTFTLLGHMDGRVRLSEDVLESKEFEVLKIDRPTISNDTYYPLEVKSFSFNEYQRWRNGRFEVFPAYAAQFSCYMAATSSSIGIYTTKDRSGGRRQLFVLGAPPVEISDIVEKIGSVVEHVNRGELVPGEYDNSSIECRRCEFRTSICKSKAEIIEDEDLLGVLRSYDRSREEERVAKAEKDRCRELVLSYGKERFRLGEFAVAVNWYDRENVGLRKLLELVPREQVEEAISSSHFARLSVTNVVEVE